MALNPAFSFLPGSFISLFSFSAISGETILGDFCESELLSLDSFGTTAADFFMGPANPVKGWKGDVYGPEYETASVLPKTPIMQGSCALSPSKKNPNTVSACSILGVFALLQAPDPSVTPRRTCAQGRSSFGNSSSEYG